MTIINNNGNISYKTAPELNTGFFEASAQIHDKIFALVIALGFGALNLLSQKLAQKKPSYMKDYQKNRPLTAEQEQQQNRRNNNRNQKQRPQRAPRAPRPAKTEEAPKAEAAPVQSTEN